MLKNILFGQRTKKVKKGRKIFETGHLCEERKVKGREGGARGHRKGVSLEKESVRCPTLQVILAENGALLHFL